MIDAGRAVDDEALAELAGNLVAVDDHVLDCQFGAQVRECAFEQLREFGDAGERSLPVTQGVSALKQAKRWSRSCALNTATWVSHSRPVLPTSSLSGGAMCVWTK